MKALLRLASLLLALGILAGGFAAWRIVRHGISARDQPTMIETIIARRLRHLAVPRAARDTGNPVALSDHVLKRARAHFADHCASCHGNDGRGKTPIGQNLYPKAPDMTLPATQDLKDGEIFHIIENGVRLTGMPAWGEAGAHDATQSWELVYFIRHLPKITPAELEEMERLNPKTRAELDEEERIQKFLAGEEAEPPAGGQHEH